MSELAFLVEETVEGGFTAQGIGVDIATRAALHLRDEGRPQA